MVDDYGRSLTKGVETVETVIATAITDIGAYLTALHAVSDAGWQKQDYLAAGVVSQAPGAGANRDTGATIKVTLDNGKNYAFRIPMPAASIINVDGSVDVGDADVLALIALFETGGKLRVSDGNYVTAVLSGSLDK
jgi:hypothetical protein